ncbi:MAG: serine protease [Chitinophagales bacterium]|nr:MAG: serine protease [Chitinophagales bacterium]
MSRLFILITTGIGLYISHTTYAQLPADSVIYHKYWIQFSDKNNSPFSLQHPEAFLSQRAIERRNRQGIHLDSTDLPVSPFYVDSVLSTGVRLLLKSKWLNGVAVETTDTAALRKIAAMPFVKEILPAAAYTYQDTSDTSGIESIRYIASPVRIPNLLFDEELYGSSFNQIHLVHGEYLHEQGFRGEGMLIAVLDAGFYRADSLSAFDSLWLNNRVVAVRDFVSGLDDSIYRESTHGMSVLSIMSGNLPGQMYGTAPAASYLLVRTEDARTEYRIEEYNWAAGAEFADSLGADVINSSLGYTRFDDPQMHYTYADMNGETAIVSRAAHMAASKGMIVVTSAGNQGNGSWKYISAPADAADILSVGALDTQGQYVSFSSRGPTADGRVKPDVAAQGKDVVHVSYSGMLSTGNGTSFASPIIAGLAACLWQAFPEKTAMQMIGQIIQSCSSVAFPNDSVGNGIPDFRLAFLKLLEEKGPIYYREYSPVAFPNPFSDELHIMVFTPAAGTCFVEISDAMGRVVARQQRLVRELRFHQFDFNGLHALQSGIYLCRIGNGKDVKTLRLLKF